MRLLPDQYVPSDYKHKELTERIIGVFYGVRRFGFENERKNICVHLR
jgi:hypothetical protein